MTDFEIKHLGSMEYVQSEDGLYVELGHMLSLTQNMAKVAEERGHAAIEAGDSDGIRSAATSFLEYTAAFRVLRLVLTEIMVSQYAENVAPDGLFDNLSPEDIINPKED